MVLDGRGKTMKNIFKVFIFFCVLLSCIPVSAEEGKKQKIAVSLDFLNTSPAFGLNVEYSPNKYFDFGLGFSPSLFIIAEGHMFARVCFCNNFIQPYLQLGVSFVAPGQIDMNQNWFNARCGAGAKFSIGEKFCFGVGAGYSFVGQNLTPLSLYGFYPTIFIGYCVANF